MAGSDGGPKRAARAVTRLHNPVEGALWMLLSCALLAGVAALGRYATSAGVPALQVVFLRLLFALLIMLPLFAIRGRAFVRTNRLKAYVFRALIGLLAMTSWFSALSYIQVGELTAISFLTPIFATLIAALFLSERVLWQRWTSMVAGLTGTLIILRPGLIEIGPGIWFALAAALAMGVSMNLIKSLTASDDPDKIVFLSSALMTPLAMIPAMIVWVWPPLYVWPFLVALGPAAMLGQVTLTRAFAAADASFVAGFDFARLPFAVVYGWLAFGELIDFWTWFGAGLIFAASLICSRVEARSSKKNAPNSEIQRHRPTGI